MSIDEWDQREVCPDGACVGVIGPDGLCKVCGRAAQNWGDERKRGMVAEPADAAVEVPEAPGVTTGGATEVEDHEWGRRTLCPDGACVGVIGTNGKCTVCGKGPDA